jgi:hypothetical protein
MDSRTLRSGLIILVLLVTGCSSSIVTGSWKDPNYSGQVKKVYVVGIAKQETTRRIFEDEFCKQLATFGVTGLSSYRDLPASEEINKEMIEAKARANGADSVLLTRAIGKRTEEVVNPGRISNYDYGPRGYYPDPYYRNYGSYYARSRDIVYQPATVSQFEVVTIEANLYNAANAELIWSAQLETVVEENLGKLLADFIETVTKDLNAKGLI